MGGIWSFLQDTTNQQVLTWIGGGLVVVVGGLWAAFTFFFPKKSESSSAPSRSVTADRGGIAAGGDIINNKIDTRGGTKR